MTQGKYVETAAARLRDQLGYPVIDGDGHLLELVPVFADFVRDHGRSDLVESAPIFKRADVWRQLRDDSLGTNRNIPKGMPKGIWMTAGDTDYFATVTTPSRYYERLAETGIDFAVLYPTLGLHLGQLPDDDERVALCNLYNDFMAELYGPYMDRFAVPAAIPMYTPGEAVTEMIHAHQLGAKVALIPGYVRRGSVPNAAVARNSHLAGLGWGDFGSLDTFGLDSAFDYAPVWAKAIELGLPLAVHSNAQGFTDRATSNYVYNHIGHFAAINEAFAKSFFFSGVTRRFPDIKVAMLEGGVAVGVRVYADIVAHWHKRGAHVIDKLNPENIDRLRLATLLSERDPKMSRYSADELIAPYGGPEGWRDDFAETGVQSIEDIRDQFCSAFYWGCEADDPLVGLAFDNRVNPLGAQVPAMMGSDLGHWDVVDFHSPLVEACELIDRGILSETDLRQFLFTNPVRCYGSLNPNFFSGTVVEKETAEVLGTV